MRFLLFFMALIFFSCAPAYAQGTSFLSEPQYHAMVRQAVVLQPANFDFTGFRMNYSGTSAYDPLGARTKDLMLKYAYDAGNNEDPEKQKKALEDYTALVAEHLANIDVVTQALALSRQDARFGDPALYEWLRAGLIQSIMESGNGETLSGAYDVITLGEENALLSALNVDVLKTDMRQSGAVSYNMHEVQDDKHAGSYTVFVNVSIPMDWLAQEKQAAQAKIVIPQQ